MEMQNSFPNSTGSSASPEASSNFIYNSQYADDTWPTLEGLTYLPPPAYPIVPDEPLQMLHLRFPTPPITPPYTTAIGREVITEARKDAAIESAFHAPTGQTRTQTVIMKISRQDLCSQQSPQLNDDSSLPDIDIVNLDSTVVSKFNGHSRLHDQQIVKTSNRSSSPKHAEHICEWHDCGREHHSLDALAAHVTKVHAIASTSDGLYYCRWRGCTRARGFSARYKMLVHARTHTKEKPHQCHLCSKCFSRAENLKIHIRSHSGEKPYLCTYEGCHKAYSNSSDRFKHTRTHSMDKPYLCKVPGCQKRYTDPSSLRKHVKTFKHALQLIGTAAMIPISSDSAPMAATPELEPTETPLQSTMPRNVEKSDAMRYHSHDTVFSGYQRYSNADNTAPVAAPASLSEPAPTSMALCRLCAQPDATSQLQHYYLHGTEEDFCHIKTTPLDYYYTPHTHMTTRHNMNATNYWYTHSKLNVVAESAMDLEAPLDLRVNRSRIEHFS